MKNVAESGDREVLKRMTLEELWQLFPITLSRQNPRWKQWAADEISTLTNILSAFNPTISHIGSTAIAGICSKPIVDILVEISPEIDRKEIITLLESEGYICMAESPIRISFNKGYTPAGYATKVFHIHVRSLGDNDEILFRDYLNEHPETAREYESLKLSLLPKYRHDRDAYTSAKGELIRDTLAKAHSESAQQQAETECITIKHWASPCGELVIGAYRGSICMCNWSAGKRRDSIERLLSARLNAPFIEGTTQTIEKAITELEEYFNGKRISFDIPLIFTGSEFQCRVWTELMEIPFGTTISYGELARRIDNPAAVRAVASANARNPISIFVPCHRVIGSDNTLTGYSGGLEAKRTLLNLERPNLFN